VVLVVAREMGYFACWPSFCGDGWLTISPVSPSPGPGAASPRVSSSFFLQWIFFLVPIEINASLHFFSQGEVRNCYLVFVNKYLCCRRPDVKVCRRFHPPPLRPFFVLKAYSHPRFSWDAGHQPLILRTDGLALNLSAAG